MAQTRDTSETAGLSAAPVARLLGRWQSDHDPEAFATLVEIIRGPLQRLAASTLRRIGIRDPGACDEAVSLVFERLYRLGIEHRVDAVAPFDSDRPGGTAAGDPGWVYVRCVARSRAHDVARAVRRRDRRDCDYGRTAAAWVCAAEEPSAGDVDATRVRAAIEALDERSRAVVSLVLDGKSQAAIAHMLGVCEGTVSRIRMRAIARLRAVLAARTGGG